MPNAKANKLVPVVDGTAGTPIELQDARINTDNVENGNILIYNGTDGVFEPGNFPAQVNADWNANSGAAQILNKPTIPTVPTNVSVFTNDAGYITSAAIPTHRTINHEQLTDSSLGNINIHDGFYFPNAVQDYDGNWYGAVVIGDQVWLGENLRTTCYSNGTAIPKISSTNVVSATTPYYYEIDNVDEKLYGYLYNLPAMMNGASPSNTNPSGVQGIAPAGWHVPSQSEFLQLSEYLGKQSRFAIGNASNIAKAIATDNINIWDQSNVDFSPGNNVAENNATSLNIVPAGRIFNGYDYKGQTAFFWCTDYDNNNKAVSLNYTESTFRFPESGGNEAQGFSVRCICDLSPVQFRNWYLRQYGSMQHHLPQEISAQVNADWNATSGAAEILNKPALFSGNYNDLTNKPTIDTELSETSTNIVQNKAINVLARKLWDKVDIVTRLDSEYLRRNLYVVSATNNKWGGSASSSYKHWIVPVNDMREVTITSNGNASQFYSFFKTYSTPVSGNTPDYATGYNGIISVGIGETKTIPVPSDAQYLYLNTGNNGAAKATHILLIGIGITEHNGDGTGFVKDDGSIDYNEYLTSLTHPQEVYICQYANDCMSNGVTVNDIMTAYNAGKLVYCELKYEHNSTILNAMLHLSNADNSQPVFVGIDKHSGDTRIYILKYDSGEETWNLNTEIIGQSVLPSIEDNADKALFVNSTGDGLEWRSAGSGGASSVTSVIPSGTVSGSAATNKLVSISSVTTVTDGTMIRVRNNDTRSDGNVTLNLNSLGAKPIYIYRAGTVARMTDEWLANLTLVLVYNTRNTSLGRWDVIGLIPHNTGNGFGMFTCDTEAATVAKTAANTSTHHYNLNINSFVCVKFTNAVPANATLSIDDTTAKPIGYRGAAISDNVIKAGDTATFVYDGTYYQLVSIDRLGVDSSSLSEVAFSGDYDDLLNLPDIYTEPSELGIGYGTSTSTTSDNTYEVNMQGDFNLKHGAVINVKFTNAMPAGMSITIDRTTMDVMYQGQVIAAGCIQAGDTAQFVLLKTRGMSGDTWISHLANVDRWSSISGLDDTEISSLGNYQTLLYVNEKWRNIRYPEINGGLCMPTDTSPYDTIIPLHSTVDSFLSINLSWLNGSLGRPLLKIVFTAYYNSATTSQIVFSVTNDYRLHFNQDADFELSPYKPYKLITCTRINDGFGHLSFAVKIKDLTTSSSLGNNEHPHLIAAT